MRQRQVMRNPPGVGQDVAFVQRQESVEPGDPVGHVHGLATHCLALGEEQVVLDQVVQRQQFVFGEIVLGDADVGLADFRASP